MKKLCSGIMALSIVLTSVNFPARASEPDTGAGMEAENFSEADSLDEFQDAVTDLNEDLDLEPEGKYASRRLIVLSDTDGFDTYGAESVVSFDGIYLLSYASEQDCSSAFRNLSKDSGITSVEVDGVLETGADTDSAGGKETVHQAVDTPLKTYLDTLESTDEVRVAVLDTGIEEEFLELDEVIDTKTNLSNSGNADSVIDDNGHGTEIASIILLNGNENTKVMPVKIANQDGCATVMGAYLGIRQAVENGADIINISMNAKQSVSSQILSKAVDEAYDAGVAVVVSAGNDGVNTGSVTPANIESAIVVSAIDSSNEIAPYSNYGDTVDYCSFGDYEGKSGTSYAAAVVSGILANALSKGISEEELGEFAEDLWDGENTDLYGKGLLAYEYSIFDEDGGAWDEGDGTGDEEGEPDKDYLNGRDESYVAMMRYVGLGDENFDIKNDFANIEFDKTLYKIEFVSCHPEFNVDEEGSYSAVYKLTNRYTGAEEITSRNLVVIDDKEYMDDYELRISAAEVTGEGADPDGSEYEGDLASTYGDKATRAVEKQDQTTYTAYTSTNDFPSVDFEADHHLPASYAKAYMESSNPSK